jgi:hypothetical protein
MAVMQYLTMAGITPGAERFTTGAVLPEEQASGAELSTVRGQRPGLSTEIGKRLGDTLHPAARAAYARAPSAATAMVDRKRVTRHAEAPVWVAVARVAEADLMAVVVGGGNRSQVMFLVICETLKNGVKPYAANETERPQISSGQSS